MINIAQLRLQLVKFAKDGLPALENHASGIGQQQPATVADQQRAVQLIFKVFKHLADGGLRDEKFLRRAGKALLANHFDKITQRSDIHNYSLRLYL